MTDIPAIKQILEGAILAADKPLSIDALIQLFDRNQPARVEIKKILVEIADECEGRGFELKEVASGFRFQVRHEYSKWVDRLW
ncbi:MAG TPA: SMC-Scp complex subunit ScpB, partial [Pseudomonadales bacterium]|nr:SMC-Scp complex subunit ScpB [Pseudomonadales bacterium]